MLARRRLHRVGLGRLFCVWGQLSDYAPGERTAHIWRRRSAAAGGVVRTAGSAERGAVAGRRSGVGGQRGVSSRRAALFDVMDTDVMGVWSDAFLCV